MNKNPIKHILATFLVSSVLLLLVGLGLVSSPQAIYAQGTTLTVNTADDVFDGTCDATHCSFREAIGLANATAGTEPVTITFDSDYTIIIATTDINENVYLPSVNRSSGPVYIDGDRDDDGQPDVTIDGTNVSDIYWGLRIRSDQVTVDGLVIQDVNGTSCEGLVLLGTSQSLIQNTHLLSNTLGLRISNNSTHNRIEGCTIAHNSDDGVLVSTTDLLSPVHNNVISGTLIEDNTNRGVIIQRAAYTNTIQGSIIAGNGGYGIYINPGPTNPTPPQNNALVDNEIYSNGATEPYPAGVCNDRTHEPPGVVPTANSAYTGYDNLFAGNVISGNSGFGIYNIGASPLITDNQIIWNESDGIYNLPDFGGTYDPESAGDDILSIPVIKNNVIADNGHYGIQSLDTAPVDRHTLHTDNTFGDHGEFDIIQAWLGAVEVLTGTVGNFEPISQGITARVVGSGDPTAIWILDDYGDAEPDYASGAWSSSGFNYQNIRDWGGIREFVVADDGTVTLHDVHTISIRYDGTLVDVGTVLYSFDGLTSTHPISGDVLIPQWVETGPFGRYQVAEINFAYDTDNDGIPDVVEGPGDSDGDGDPDYLDDDSDNDGIPDDVEGPGDSDGDGDPDYLDEDSDDDGIPDSVEAGPHPETPQDSDGDGTPDYLDDDSDNDGIPDSTEGQTDTDGDGIPDYIENNNDDPDGDGDTNEQDTDSDGDGISDDDEYYSGEGDDALSPDCTADTDNDGISDCEDNDVDGDGIPNYLDGDSDGDGIPDSEEGQGDSDSDGIPDWIDPEDGADTSQGGDSDGDGISDAEEYYSGESDATFCTDRTVDTDGDDVYNCVDNDVDGDGIPNYLDTDSDNDGTLDENEPDPPTTNPSPFDHGDVPAWIDPMYRIYLPTVLKGS